MHLALAQGLTASTPLRQLGLAHQWLFEQVQHRLHVSAGLSQGNTLDSSVTQRVPSSLMPLLTCVQIHRWSEPLLRCHQGCSS